MISAPLSRPFLGGLSLPRTQEPMLRSLFHGATNALVTPTCMAFLFAKINKADHVHLLLYGQCQWSEYGAVAASVPLWRFGTGGRIRTCCAGIRQATAQMTYTRGSEQYPRATRKRATGAS